MKKHIQNLYPYLFALFCASIPFTDTAKAIPNLLLGVLVLVFGFVVRKEDFAKLQSKSFYFLALFVAVISLVTVLSGRWEDIKYITNTITFCIIVIISIPVKQYTLSLKSFVISSLLLLLISSVYVLLFAVNGQGFDLTSGGHINELLLGERPYLGFIYIMSSCICWYLAEKTENKKGKILWYAISLIFIVFVALISARMALISFFVILLISIFYLKKKPKVLLILFTGFLTFGTLFILNNENVKNRFYLVSETSVNEKLTFEPRYHIWQCVGSLQQNTVSLLFGKGFKQTENELVECYKNKQNFVTEDQQQWFVRSRFNTHNQYFDILLGAGAIALIGFLTFLSFLFIENRKNYFSVSLIILLGMFFLTESLIHRQIGVFIIGITLVFVECLNDRKTK